MLPGQFLVNKDGEKRKIIERLGNLIAVGSLINNWFGFLATEEQLRASGWSLVEEPWVPEPNENLFHVDSYGYIDSLNWYNLMNESKQFLIKTGNYFRIRADAELYKQKLIDRMGKDFDRNYYRVGIDLASGKDRSVNS